MRPDSKIQTQKICFIKKQRFLNLSLMTNKGRCQTYQALRDCNRIWNKEHCCNKYIKRAKYVCSIDKFLYKFRKGYDKHPIVSTDGGIRYPLEFYKFLKLKHHLHSAFEKSIIIERTINTSKIEPNALKIIFHGERKSVK